MVEVSSPAVPSAVLLSGTARFVVVHNYPSGSMAPTNLDMALTKAIMEACDMVGLYSRITSGWHPEPREFPERHPDKPGARVSSGVTIWRLTVSIYSCAD